MKPSSYILDGFITVGLFFFALTTLSQIVVSTEVVVRGTEVPDSVTSPSLKQDDKEKETTPGGLTIISVDKVRRGRVSNLEDLLAQTPGLFTQTENGTEVTKLSIRGSGIESDDEPVGVALLLDGLNYNQGDGEVLPEDLAVDSMRYAEVYRGADALRYGSITLGGAINFVPATGYDSELFAARLEGGSYGYLRSSIATGDVIEPFDYFASFTARRRDGFREHSKEDTEILFADLGWRWNDQWENRFYLTLDRTDRDLPGGLTKKQLQNDPQQADPVSIEQNWNKSWTYVRLADRLAFQSESLDFTAGLFWFHRDLTELGFFSPEFRAGIENYYSDNYGGELRLVRRGEIFGRKSILTVGASAQYEYEKAQNYENLNGRAGATTARGANVSINAPLYFETQQYLTDHLSLLAGAQFTYAQRRYIDHFPDSPNGNQSNHQNSYGASPKIGAIYELEPATQLFANFSRSFQPPTLDNLADFSDGPGSSITYTPLSPQRAWTLELGTRGRHGPFTWELSLYRSRVRDELLELNDTQGNDIGTTNVRRSIHRGIEVSLEARPFKSIFYHGATEASQDELTLEQSYTLNDFHFDGDPVYGDDRLGGIPEHFYEAQLLYETPNGIYFGPSLRCNITSYPVDHANSLFVDPYALLGFKIGYRAKKGWSAYVEARNLTDERYPSAVDAFADARTEDANDIRVFYPGDGRSFYGGLSWNW